MKNLFIILLLATIFIGCKTAEPFDGEVEGYVVDSGWYDRGFILREKLPNEDTVLDRFYFLNDSMKVREFVIRGGGSYADTVLTDELNGITTWGSPLPYTAKITEFEQRQDTIPTAIDSLIAQLKDIYAVPADMSNYRYLDTLKVLLLCGDTSRYYTGAEGWYEIDPQVFWKAGYIIIERFAPWAKFSWLFTPAEPTFLDRKKKPLESRYVVWMVKEIN